MRAPHAALRHRRRVRALEATAHSARGNPAVVRLGRTSGSSSPARRASPPRDLRQRRQDHLRGGRQDDPHRDAPRWPLRRGQRRHGRARDPQGARPGAGGPALRPRRARRGLRAVPEIADLVRLATRMEYAEARWRPGTVPSRRVDTGNSRFRRRHVGVAAPRCADVGGVMFLADLAPPAEPTGARSYPVSPELSRVHVRASPGCDDVRGGRSAHPSRRDSAVTAPPRVALRRRRADARHTLPGTSSVGWHESSPLVRVWVFLRLLGCGPVPGSRVALIQLGGHRSPACSREPLASPAAPPRGRFLLQRCVLGEGGVVARDTSCTPRCSPAYRPRWPAAFPRKWRSPPP